MKKLTAAQQKVIDSIKASAAKFAGKTYEEAYPRVEDRDRWSKKVYEKAQKGHYLVEAHPNTIAALLKAGIIEHEGDSLFYGLVEDKKEEETMTTETMNTTTETIELKAPVTFERANGLSPVTLVKAEKRWYDRQWHFVDTDNIEWYRNPNWDNDECLMAFYMMDSSRGQEIQISTDTYEALINNDWEIAEETTTTENEKEETTMKTTFTTLNGTTYTMNPQTNRYAKTVDGKTTRIGKAEYEKAQHEYELEQEVEALELHPVDEQAELDKEPCRVEVENDLEKPAVLNEHGLVDCFGCNCTECVHRNCMRRNPRNVGGLGRCPRLDNGILSEAQKMAEETGMELAEAELAVNVRNEQKKARKARKSKDIAYEGHGKTLTAKQVDFILHLSDSCFWEHGLESALWTDVLCDEIGGQFAGKPMTVGAMISTLCEKGLAERAKDSITDMSTGRTRKATYMVLTELGQEIAKELGLK